MSTTGLSGNFALDGNSARISMTDGGSDENAAFATDEQIADTSSRAESASAGLRGGGGAGAARGGGESDDLTESIIDDIEI